MYETINRIDYDKREQRKWDLQSRLAVGRLTSFGADEGAGEFFQNLWSSLETENEESAAIDAEMKAREKELEKRNAELIAKFRAKEQAGTASTPGGGTIIMLDGK